MELILSIIGTIVSIAIAIYEHRRATRAEEMLSEVLRQLPTKLLEDLAPLIARSNSDQDPFLKGGNLQVRFADLNGDGRDEVLVEYLSGPHSTSLQAYGFKRGGVHFGKLGEISSTTAGGFDIEGIDGDGTIGVLSLEIAKEPDLPYSFGLRDRVAHKLTGRGFKEVTRVKCYTDEELQEALANGGNSYIRGGAA